MKNSLVIIALLLAGSTLYAQDTEVIYSTKKSPREVKTLMKDNTGFGGHLSLNIAGTQIYDDPALMLGGELVFTLSHVLNMGFAGYGMPSRIGYRDYHQTYSQARNVEMGYGGLFVEPVFFDKQMVHFTVPVLIGAGWVGISDRNYLAHPYEYYPPVISAQSAYFVFQPGVNMEVNLARNIRFTLGGAYRMVNGSDIPQLTDGDLSGFSFQGGIRVGWF